MTVGKYLWFTFLLGTLGKHDVNVFDANGELCHKLAPPARVKCPTYCVSVNDSMLEEDVQVRCPMRCQGTDERLWPDGSCKKITEVCGVGGVVERYGGFNRCRGLNVTFNNPCGCVGTSKSLYQPCPGVTEVYIQNFKESDDISPPLASTLEHCAETVGKSLTAGGNSGNKTSLLRGSHFLGQDGDLAASPALEERLANYVLTGSDDQPLSGFLMCPVQEVIPMVKKPRIVFWCLTGILVSLLLVFTLWQVRRFKAELCVLKDSGGKERPLRGPSTTFNQHMKKLSSSIASIKKSPKGVEKYDDIDLSTEGALASHHSRPTTTDLSDSDSEVIGNVKRKSTLRNVKNSTLEDDLGIVSQKGYRRSKFGTLILASAIVFCLVLHMGMLIQILDVYGVFGSWICKEKTEMCEKNGIELAGLTGSNEGLHYHWRQGWVCGAHCLFSDAWSSGQSQFWPFAKEPYGAKSYLLLFLFWWILTIILTTNLILEKKKLILSHSLRTALQRAQYVEIRYRKDRAISAFGPTSSGWAQRASLRLDKWLAGESSHYEDEICPVHVEKDGTKYINFHNHKLVFSHKKYKYARAIVSPGKTCAEIVKNVLSDDVQISNDVQSSASFAYSSSSGMGSEVSAIGLSQAEAEDRMALMGPNILEVGKSTLWQDVLEEFTSTFFLYQLFCMYVWYIFYYWLAASILLVVIFGSILVRLVSKRVNTQKIKSLIRSIPSNLVVRHTKAEGNSVELSVQPISRDLAVGDLVLVEDNMELAADMVLIQGTCITHEAALTGEPTPVPKESLPLAEQPYLKNGEHKKHTLFAGTRVTQVTSKQQGTALAVIVAVGAETARGEMLSRSLRPARIRFKFEIQWHLVFSILLVWAAANVVLGVYLVDWALEGWYYGIFTISQVISPLVPAVFVVGQAVAASRLSRKGIHCSNLQRTFVAGKAKIICFDKTGTLTQPNLNLDKVIVFGDNGEYKAIERECRNLLDVSSHPNVLLGLNTCHELQSISLSGVSEGPETATANLTGGDVDLGISEWTRVILQGGDNGGWTVRGVDGTVAEVVCRYPFERTTMSSSVIIKVPGTAQYRAYTKGSLDAILSMCQDEIVLPDSLAYIHNLAKNGAYVIALAAADLPNHVAETSGFNRQTCCQQNLSLIACLAFENSIHPDVPQTIVDLQYGGSDICMITGDHPYTAVAVARQSGIISHKHGVWLGKIGNDGQIWWSDELAVNPQVGVVSPSSNRTGSRAGQRQYNFVDMVALCRGEPLERQQATLAVTGDVWDHLVCGSGGFVHDILPYIKVFARMSPCQKVEVIENQMRRGITAMIGDGANDTAALARAHVGLAVRAGMPTGSSEAAGVAHFASEKESLKSLVSVLKEGRCALANTTNTYRHLIIYGEIMVAVSALEMYLLVVPPEGYFIMVDAVINPLALWAMSQIGSAKTLAPFRPPSAILGAAITIPTILHIFSHWFWMVGAILLLFHQSWFQCHEFDPPVLDHALWWAKGDNFEAATLGLFAMFQWISVPLTLNFGMYWRRSFIRNWRPIVVFVAAFMFVLLILNETGTLIPCLFRTNCGDGSLLSYWFENKVQNGIVQTDFGNDLPFYIPAGCPCTDGVPNCEGDYSLTCKQPYRYISHFHHNIFPRSWRTRLIILAALNILTNLVIELLTSRQYVRRVTKKIAFCS